MSGSGPTVFGVFANAGEAREALDQVAPEAPGWARVALAAKEVPNRHADAAKRHGFGVKILTKTAVSFVNTGRGSQNRCEVSQMVRPIC